MSEHYNDNLLIEGTRYTVGTNDGGIFKDVIFEGTKQFYGKTMMCFKTDKSRDTIVNQSYFSFAVEGETDMNEVTYKQGKEQSWAD